MPAFCLPLLHVIFVPVASLTSTPTLALRPPKISLFFMLTITWRLLFLITDLVISEQSSRPPLHDRSAPVYCSGAEGGLGGCLLTSQGTTESTVQQLWGFVIVEGCLSWSRVLPTYLFLSPYLCIVVLRQCTALRSDGFVSPRHKATSVFGICRR